MVTVVTPGGTHDEIHPTVAAALRSLGGRFASTVTPDKPKGQGGFKSLPVFKSVGDKETGNKDDAVAIIYAPDWAWEHYDRTSKEA
jgi:hypothetical protein